MTAAQETVGAQRPDGWSSRAMFVAAAAGSAVGLGNIWKFPYIVGENGGGAFVLVYLACLALLGLPVLIAEITIGRHGGASPAGAFRKIAAARGLSRAWGLVGAFGALTSLVILSYYSVVSGWVLLYSADYARIALGAAEFHRDSAAHFSAMTADPETQFVTLLAVVLAAFALASRRAVRGVEALIAIIGPAFVAILAGLAAYAWFSHPAPGEVLRYLFAPDFSALRPAAYAEAIGHAFFTLSVGMCAMVVYGAYLDRGADIVKLAAAVAGIDTFISIMAAFAVFGVAFAAGADPAQGPGLIFVVLPMAFQTMPGGDIVGALFFAAVFMAAFSSVIAVMIVAARMIEEALGVSTMAASAIAAALVLSGGAAVILSVSGAVDISLLGAPLLDALDALASSAMLPAVGMATAIFAARALRPEVGRYYCGTALVFAMKWIAPAALLTLAVSRFA